MPMTCVLICELFALKYLPVNDCKERYTFARSMHFFLSPQSISANTRFAPLLSPAPKKILYDCANVYKKIISIFIKRLTSFFLYPEQRPVVSTGGVKVI
jgi:hypothetical protein